MFESAREYADHLSTVIDDEDLVVLAVRRKFPFYCINTRQKRVEERDARKATGRLDERTASSGNMSKFDGWYCSELTDLSFKRNMEEGSKKLLDAIWREHPAIMKAHAEAGRMAVRPS